MPTPKNAEPDDPSPRPAKPRRQRLPFVVAVIVLMVLGANYYLYVRSKTQYYTTRDLRLLAMLGRQVDDALKTHRQFVRNFAEDRDVFPEFIASDLVYEKLNATQREIAAQNFRQFTWLSRREACAAELSLTPIDPGGTFAEQIVEINGESWLHIVYRGSDLGSAVTGCGKIRLANVLQAGFRATMVEPFDAVMLVDGTGTVLHHAAPQHQSVARAFGAARTAGDASYRRDAFGSTVDVRVNSLSALAERHGWTGASKPFEMAGLGATRKTEVHIADTAYFLFAQPSPIFIPKKKTTDTKGSTGTGQKSDEPAKETETKDDKNDKKSVEGADPNRWSFVALAAKRRFMYEALAVSETALAAVAGFLLLIVAAWPFARLSLISDFKPVRITDAIFMAVSTVVAAAIFTIAVADAVVYRRLEAVSDVQLRQFAVTLERFFGDEVFKALTALDHIEKNWNWDTEKKRTTGEFHEVGYLHGDSDEPDHPLNRFPFFSTFSWIDREGVQAFKRSVEMPIPRVKVADRDYFRRVRDRRMLLALEDDNPIIRPYAVESLRSMTSGKPEIVVAAHTESYDYPVLAMTLTTSQLIDPVLPAGFSFAVIDDQGNVLFHSDTDKNVMENFFEESDQNRQFRSVVFARQATAVDLRYAGEDYRAYVTPMKRLPWTMVTLRHKQLLRTMNAETIVITMMCLAFLITGAVILTFVILLWRPQYRAPWLWPYYERNNDYVRLCLALLLLLLAGLVSLVFYESGALIVASFALPPLAMIVTFASRHRPGGPLYAGIVALGLGLAAMWVYALTWEGQTTPNLLGADTPGWPVVAGLLLFGSGYLASQRWKDKMAETAPGAHKAMAVLLLISVAILPALGFFKAAYRLEIQNLVKYSQLTLAERVRLRTETLLKAGYRPTTTSVRHWEIPAAFNATWWLLPPYRPPGPYDCRPFVDRALPLFLQEFMPQYSEYSVSMRAMHHNQSSDGRWWWCRDGSALTLRQAVQLTPKMLTKLWPNERITGEMFASAQVVRPGRAAHEIIIPFVAPSTPWVMRHESPYPVPLVPSLLWNEPTAPPAHPLGPLDRSPDIPLISAQLARAERATEEIVVSSVVPSIFPRLMRSQPPYPNLPVPRLLWSESKAPPDPPLAGALRVVFYALLVALFAGCLWWTLTFISRVVFLTDIHKPLWLSKKLGTQIGDPVFLIRKTGTKINDLCQNGFHSIRFAHATTDRQHRQQLATIDQLPPGSCVLIEEFEQGTDASEFAHKLQLIEHVLRLRPRSIVIISTLTPLEIMALAEAAGASRQRWSEVLRQFIWIPEDQLKPFSLATTANSGNRLDREAADHPVLKEIAKELQGREFQSDGQFVDEFRERAASYYEMLWSSCTEDEKRILSQLAHEGLLNPKNRRAIRLLMGRGLIQRKPQLSLMNESFRKHVLAASAAEGVDLKHVHERDPWTNISRPLALVLVALIVMFLATQKDLANTATAVVTALAGGIPALIRLMGVLTDRKQPAS